MCAWELFSQQQQKIPGNIYIGVPYAKDFSARFLNGITSLRFPNGYGHSGHFQKGLPLDITRNIMVSHALQAGASHLFFVDSDIGLRPETLLELEEARMPIVGAVYYSRNPPYTVVANINGKPLTHQEIVNKRSTAPNGKALMEVHDIGMGAALIDCRTFYRMMNYHKLPFFCMGRHPGQLDNLEKDDIGLYYETAEAVELGFRCKYPECGHNTLVAPFFDYRIGKYTEDSLSEDYYFCKKVRETGISVYLSIATEVDHEITTFFVNGDGLHNSAVNIGVVQ